MRIITMRCKNNFQTSVVKKPTSQAINKEDKKSCQSNENDFYKNQKGEAY